MNITRNEIPNFAKAYALLQVSFIVLNKEFYIEYVNDTANALFTWGNSSHSVNQLFFQVWADLTLPELLNTKGDIIHKDPIKIAGRFWEWQCEPVKVDEEEWWLLIAKDVTEKEQMYLSLEHACENILGVTFNERFPAPYYINEVYNYLNGIINQIPCYVYWKNRALQYIGCNQMAANFINLSSTEEIIGKTDFDIFSDWDLAKEYRATDEQIFASGKAVINQPGELVNDQGEIIHTLVSKIPITNQAGEIMGLAGISVDVTDLKNAQASAELANQVKTEFIANMSHDIRTPLTGVVGMSKVLEDNADNPNIKQYARWLGESGQQLLHMLNGILDVVSADNVNESDLHEEAFNLHQVIQDIEQLERPSTIIKGIELVTSVDEAIPFCLISDPTKIHRVLLNLLGNAIKFTQVGRVEIDVKLLEKNKTHVFVQFRISDTGIGIPMGLQEKVFDRFYRITLSNKGTYTGHGVGLHIAQSYVHLLGGNILLSSTPGIGTTFYFNLSLKIGDCTLKIVPPRTADTLSDKVTTSFPPISFPNTPGAAQSLTFPGDVPNFLLVEDNKIALFTLENLITQTGCRFTSVMDGESALHLAQTQSFDLIITDLGLPGLSGIDLTVKIRAFEKEAQKKPVLIIGLTAHSEEKIKRSCLQAGMNEVFTKPMTLDVLLTIKKIYFPSNYCASAPSDTAQSRPHSTQLGSDLPEEDELFKLDELSVFDAQSALIGVGGDINLLKNILKSTLEKEIPADVCELEKARARDDWNTVEKLAHRMKSGFVYCGTAKLVHACLYIERYNKAGHTQLLGPLYKQLLMVIEETKSTICEWLQVN